MFYKADIRLDSKGNISKVSTGDKFVLPMATIDPKDIEVDSSDEVGGFLGKGVSASVNEGIYKPHNYPVALKTVNVMDKVKRSQLLNDLQLMVFNPSQPQNHCQNLVQLYGAYFEECNIRLVLELMDVGSLRDIMEMRREVLGSPRIEERVLAIILKQVL